MGEVTRRRAGGRGSLELEEAPLAGFGNHGGWEWFNIHLTKGVQARDGRARVAQRDSMKGERAGKTKGG